MTMAPVRFPHTAMRPSSTGSDLKILSGTCTASHVPGPQKSGSPSDMP